MTIGEKITHLRIASGISQERLATMLNVSRQSISKWESDESLPQIDKIVEFCELFKISTDDMLREIYNNRNHKNILRAAVCCSNCPPSSDTSGLPSQPHPPVH